ncbi:hypothetical protein OIV83_003616 [Microbotryomycetes sp. JL201]|nr:hypothetical protein OIV83_003616 [Microbotryomycetes sp. JL201]
MIAVPPIAFAAALNATFITNTKMHAELSDRVERHLAWTQSSVYAQALDRTFANLYSPSNESGIVNAGLAENSLMHDWLIQYYESHFKLDSLDLTYGTSLLGSTRLFQAYSSFLNDFFGPHTPLHGDKQFIAGVGLTALLDCLSRVLFDAGDKLILSRPYYNALVADFKESGDVDLVGVTVPESQNGTMAEVESMEKEMHVLQEAGQASRVKAVLLMNPHNPTGLNYPRETIVAYMKFAEKWNLWLIADEIYAMSVFDSPYPFVSVLSIDAQSEAGCDPGRIIHLYGASKDFGSNGIRIGLLTVQHNHVIFTALLKCADLPDYFERNRTALRNSYEYASSWFKARGIPHVPAQAGHFILVDLREHVRKISDTNSHVSPGEAEVELLNKMVDAGVYLAPDLYTPSNVDGVINAGLAENSLMHDWLIQFYDTHFNMTSLDLTYGTSLLGSTRLFKAYSNFLNQYFKPHDPVAVENQIIAGVGLSALLDCLSRVLFDSGDKMILARPYYNALVADFKASGNVDLVGVVVPDGGNGTLDEVDSLDIEMEKLKSEGQADKVKAVLLMNPHNPLGFNYSRETLIAYMRFAEKWNLWLVSDEIYALSVFESDVEHREPFVSVLSIDALGEAKCDPGRIIHLYGASKDFGSNGIRIGLMTVQHNKEAYEATASLAWPMKLSSPADIIFSALLNSADLPDYIKRNQEALKQSYTRATQWLKQRSIPYTPAQAGHYILIDLRGYTARFKDVAEADLDGEIELLNRMVDAGVYLGPGHSYFCPEPGFFRLTHSIPPDHLDLALQRLDAVLDKSAQ